MEPLLREKLGGAVGEVGGVDRREHALLVGLVEAVEAAGEEAVGDVGVNAVGLAVLSS